MAVRMAYPEQLDVGRKAQHAQKLKLARQKIESLIRVNGVTSRSQARRLAPAQVAFVYKFDLSWLDNILPSGKGTSKQVPNEPTRQVDWHALDIDVVKRLSVANLAVTSAALHPRVSIARLSRAIGFHNTWLHRHMYKLPKSEVLIRKLVETGESSRHRRILAAVSHLKENSLPITASRIKALSRVHSAVIRRYLDSMPAVLFSQ